MSEVRAGFCKHRTSPPGFPTYMETCGDFQDFTFPDTGSSLIH